MEYLTVSGFLSETMNQMGEGAKYRRDYEPFAVSLTNRLISECFEVNNSIRGAKGLEAKTVCPVMEGMDSEIPYEYETVSDILVYGLGYWLFYQDDEFGKANAMRAVYDENRNGRGKAAYTAIADIG